MRIGIIGAGNMGRAIGVRFAQLGHEVFFGARSKEQGEAAVKLAGRNACAGTVDDAAQHGQLLIWTVREPDVAKVLSDPTLVDEKIIVDVNNRDYKNELQAGSWFDQSIAEARQSRAPRSRVVKALNVIAMETLNTSPELLRGAGAQVFIAGDDSKAKQTVIDLMGQLGFEAVDLGAGPVAVRAVEALGDVVRLLMIDGGRGPQVNLQLRPLPVPDLHSVGARAASEYN